MKIFKQTCPEKIEKSEKLSTIDFFCVISLGTKLDMQETICASRFRINFSHRFIRTNHQFSVGTEKVGFAGWDPQVATNE